jgi:hypothetical protein
MHSAQSEFLKGWHGKIALRPYPEGLDPMKSLSHPLAVLLLFLSVCGVARADKTIVILRHAEKPALGLGQLDCRGLNRSLALPSVILSRYGKPAAIYAPNPAVLKKDKGVPYAYVRPLATIEPLAIRSGLPVDLEYDMTHIKPLAKNLIAAPDGVLVVAWEHHWGEDLARRLMAKLGGDPKAVPTWRDDDFDSMYVIHVADAVPGRSQPAFRLDREGLDGMPDTCPEAANPAPHRD